jgi:hypothetical protein
MRGRKADGHMDKIPQNVLQEEWYKILLENVHTCESIPRRTAAVLKAGPTTY